MPVASERVTLVKALSVVSLTDRRMARRFLEGLSTEELRYIASYLGACMLESAFRSETMSRDQMAGDILQYECCRRAYFGCCDAGDVEHKMILLLEYLSSCRCAAALKVPAGSA